MSKKYDDYLKTEYWKSVSDAVKKRAGYRCQLCNSQHDLCAHHRTYDHRGDELNYLGDLTCLCRRCHEIFHGKVQQDAVPTTPHPLITNADVNRILARKVSKAIRRVTVVDSPAVEIDMPPGEGPIELNRELVKACRTAAGGFTSATLSALGVPAKCAKGWVARLNGLKVSRAEYRQALEGRYIFI